MSEVLTCDFCGRPATYKVRKKYPSKDRSTKRVCGYHFRSFKTSEFKKDPIEQPTKRVRPLGYAPTAVGYAPKQEEV